MPETNTCEKCRLFLVRFPACLPIDAKLAHGESGDLVIRCKNKAKKKHAKCGTCKKYELKELMKPLRGYTWIIKAGREIEIDSEMPICPRCLQSLTERSKEIKKVAKRLGVSARYLRGQQTWIQEGRAPTVEEFTVWSRKQHKRACKAYQAAYPITYHRGKCQHLLSFKRPCVSFFSHTGICETGYFVPERLQHLLWLDFNKRARQAARIVKRELHL